MRVVVSFIRFVYSNTPKRSWAFFLVIFLFGFVWVGGEKIAVGLMRLFQCRHFAGGINEGQLIGESFLLSDCDHSILFFLCFVCHLHRLPARYMALIP